MPDDLTPEEITERVMKQLLKYFFFALLVIILVLTVVKTFQMAGSTN